MATAKKTKYSGQAAFEFYFDSKRSSSETHKARNARFEKELQQCCQADPEFAAYIERYHQGYGKGIHLAHHRRTF